MTKLVTTKNLFNEVNATTTSAAYVLPTWRSFWRYDAANWDGTVEVYFEAVLSHSAGTAYAALYTSGGSVVTGSEVSTTATTQTRVRSTNIFSAIANGTDYTIRIKASAATTTLYNARIIIKQSGTITKKEYYIPITAGGFGTTSTTLVEQTRSAIIQFDPSQWDGSYSVYLESCGSVTNGADSGITALRDTTASTYPGSTSTSATAVGRSRSAALTMNSGAAEYRCHYRSTNGFTTFNLSDAYLVVVQSGGTKGVFHSCFKNMNFSSTSTVDAFMPGASFYWDDADWNVISIANYWETTLLISNSASTATATVGLSVATWVDTTSTTKIRKTQAFTPLTEEDLVALRTSNASHTATLYGPRFVTIVDFSPPSFKPQVIII